MSPMPDPLPWLRCWFRDHRIGVCHPSICRWPRILVRTPSQNMADTDDRWYCRRHSEDYTEMMREQWASYWNSVR